MVARSSSDKANAKLDDDATFPRQANVRARPRPSRAAPRPSIAPHLQKKRRIWPPSDSQDQNGLVAHEDTSNNNVAATADADSDVEIVEASSSGNSKSPQLVSSASRLEPAPHVEESARAALEAIKSAAIAAFGSLAVAVPFGSFVQGTYLEGSDIDICISAPGVPREADEGEEKNAGQVEALKNFMQHLPNNMSVKETRLSRKIKVPIIILLFQDASGTEIEADVSMGGYDNRTGLKKGVTDRLIREILSEKPIALPFVRYVKHWAKSKGFNIAFECFLNSLCWVLLCLYFLTRQGILNLEAFSWRDEFEISTTSLPEPLQSGMGRLVSTDMLASFFEAVIDYSFRTSDGPGPPGISLVKGTAISGPPTDRAPFYIEDPGAKLALNCDDNVARNLWSAQWATILSCCATTASSLRAPLAIDRGLRMGNINNFNRVSERRAVYRRDRVVMPHPRRQDVDEDDGDVVRRRIPAPLPLPFSAPPLQIWSL